MRTSLLATKLAPPPTRANLVARPRLFAALEEGADAGITLVSAPAGYGKTTLVAEWVRNSGAPTAWLSLDEGDNDPSRFFAYLLGAFQRVLPQVGVTAEQMLGALESRRPEALLTSLINDLAALREPVTLVLDDFHLIHNLQIHKEIGFFLDRRPPMVCVVVVGRRDPDVPLARFRARFRMIEIRQGDLCFTSEEATQFLRRTMSTNISSDEVASLCEKTEGWVAGMQLAALSARGASGMKSIAATLSGAQRYVLDYLIEEVLLQQTREAQLFLLQTSILDRLCAPLCEAVLGAGEPRATSARQVLEEFERANLFIVPLDEHRTWYRYHHLFAEALREKLRAERGELIPELHRRASEWCAEHGLLLDAIQHSLACQDWDRAAALIVAATERSLRHGEVYTLLTWYEALPAELVESKARLCQNYAWPLLLAGRVEAAERLLLRAEELAPTEVPPPDGDLQSFLGSVAAAKSYLARAKGEPEKAVALAHKALALLPDNDSVTRSVVGATLGVSYWHAGRMNEAESVLRAALVDAYRSGNEYARVGARIFLARVAAVRGQLRAAVADYREVIAAESGSPVLALAYLDLAALHYEWNELAASRDYLQTATALAKRTEHNEIQLAAELVRARISTAEGDARGALDIITRAREWAGTRSLPSFLFPGIAAAGIETALAAGDLALAEKWAGNDAPEADAHLFYRFLGLNEARLLARQGDKRGAAAGLEQRFELAERAGWGFGAIATRVTQAVAAENGEQAVGFVEDALRRGESEGFIRTFVDAGPALVPLLQEAARRGTAPAYAGEILRAAQAAHLSAQAPGADASLSKRELEVLRLLAAGMSNTVIAETLTLSTGTVKTHVHNIAGKLGAANRTEAVANARKRGLV